MQEIDMQTMTLYAELVDILKIAEASRTIASLQGSFSVKEVKGEAYIYFRTYSPGGKLHELYLGPRSDQIDSIMQSHAKGKTGTSELNETLRRLSSQIRSGITIPFDKTMIRVIKSLAYAGVFSNGGVLIGTHAFQAIGLALGVNWTSASMMTSDVDLAIAKNIAIALPQLSCDIPTTLDSLQLGFYPVPRLNNRDPSTTFAIRNSQLRVDIVTPKTQESDAPVFIKRFNCAAEPLPYVSYVIESPLPAALLDTQPVLINIPQPARYALHKLIVSQTRDVSGDTKRHKDLFQAYQILSVLQENRPFDIIPAWNDLIGRGPKWKKYAEAGLAAMEKRFGTLLVRLTSKTED